MKTNHATSPTIKVLRRDLQRRQPAQADIATSNCKRVPRDAQGIRIAKSCGERRHSPRAHLKHTDIMREHSNYSKTAPKKYRTKLAPPKARQLNRIEKVKSSQSFSRPDEADPLGVKMFPFFGDYLRSYIMDGQVWFHRNDVLERLSLIESPKWNRLLLPRERQSRAVQVLRESSNMDVVGLVAETGLYKLMVSSKDRRAEQFRELGGEMVMKLSREGDPNDAKIWQSCREIMQSVRRIYREEAARFVERMASNPFEQGNEFGEAGIIPGTELEIPW